MPYFHQGADNWCWAACCEMLLGFFQRADVGQCQMAHDQFGGECCADPTPAACNQGCFPEDAYDRYGISVGRRGDHRTQADLDAELDAGRSVEIYFTWSKGGAHVALVVNRDGDGRYEVNDPWFGAGPHSYADLLAGYNLGRWAASYVGISV